MPRKTHRLFTLHGKRRLQLKYTEEGKSIREIAKQESCSLETVYNALLFHNIEIRSKSDAQKQALATGKSVHPTEGKERDSNTKNKIGAGLRNYWKSLTPNEKIVRNKEAVDRWNSLPEELKEKNFDKAVAANRLASKEGSKFEKHLFAALSLAKIKVQLHKKHLISNTEMEVDLFLPYENICIEVDGPAHFEPIWGEEALAKRVEADRLKNYLLTMGGFIIVRIQNNNSYLSKTRMRNFSNRFVKFIQELINTELDINNRVFYLRITDED